MASERALGNDWLFKVGTNPNEYPILCQSDGVLNAEAAEIDATCKEDTAQFLLAGKPGYTFSVTAKLDEENTTSKYSFNEVADAFVAGTTLDYVLGRTTSGDTIFSGTCVVGSFTLNTPLDEVPEWEATFNVRTLTVGTN